MSVQHGGYVTRGRAGDLEKRLDGIEARLHERLDQLEQEIAELRELPFELARAHTAALVEVSRNLRTRGD